MHLHTGVDEHGAKIQATAQAAGRPPAEHCDLIAERFQALWQELAVEAQSFARTSSPRHREFVQAIYARSQAAGDIYEGEYTGLYCQGCEDFKNERELLSGGLCPIHLQPVTEYRERNYFFRLSRYQDKLNALLSDEQSFIWPAWRREEVLSWLNAGLKDFPVSRRSVSWGIPVPGDPEQTIYVWFDALLGYFSPLLGEGTAEIGPDTDLHALLPRYRHIVGKDILRFHAVYWPAICLSAGLPLPTQIIGHGFLTKDGQKMGKSLGNVIEPFDLLARFGADAVRFYFCFAVPFGADGDYSESSFVELCNAYLANRLGNLFSRLLKLASKYWSLTAPADYQVPETVNALPPRVIAQIEAYAPHEALGEIFKVVDELNYQLTQQRPWESLKQDPASPEFAAATQLVWQSLASLRVVANLLQPVLPELGQKMLSIYDPDRAQPEPDSWSQINERTQLAQGQQLQHPGPIFNRLVPTDGADLARASNPLP